MRRRKAQNDREFNRYQLMMTPCFTPQTFYNFWWYCARFSLPLPLPVTVVDGHVPSHSILTLMLQLYSWAVFGVDWHMSREISKGTTISRENSEHGINSSDQDRNKDNSPGGSDDILRLDTSMSLTTAVVSPLTCISR